MASCLDRPRSADWLRTSIFSSAGSWRFPVYRSRAAGAEAHPGTRQAPAALSDAFLPHHVDHDRRRWHGPDAFGSPANFPG